MTGADHTPAELSDAAARLVGARSISLRPAGDGANSRIYRLEADGRIYALKAYPRRQGDTRDRLEVEWQCLRFLADNRIGQAPMAIARDDVRRLMVIEWLEGPLVTRHTLADLDDAIGFVLRVFAASQAPGADAFPPASEACLSAREIVRQLDDRLTRFAPHAAMSQFMEQDFLPAYAAARGLVTGELAAPAELAPAQRRLIPADFGFHNAIRTASGLRYIDFDYFGWDDPVKLIADFLLHPAMALTDEEQSRARVGLLEGLAGDADAGQRLGRHLALYALRWALIVLNPLRVDRWSSLPSDAAARAQLIDRQLAKAKALVARADTAVSSALAG